MSGEGIREDKRRAALRRCMIERKRYDTSKRQAADVRVGNAKLVHGGDDGSGIIVTCRAWRSRIALAIAGVIKSNRATLLAEEIKLRVPHRPVGPDAV